MICTFQVLEYLLQIRTENKLESLRREILIFVPFCCDFFIYFFLILIGVFDILFFSLTNIVDDIVANISPKIRIISFLAKDNRF